MSHRIVSFSWLDCPCCGVSTHVIVRVDLEGIQGQSRCHVYQHPGPVVSRDLHSLGAVPLRRQGCVVGCGGGPGTLDHLGAEAGAAARYD